MKIFLAVIIGICMNSSCYGLDVSTHEAINVYLTTQTINQFSLNSYLRDNLGIESGITQALFSDNEYENSKVIGILLRDGGEYEDAPPENYIPYRRSRNHFHNPLKPWMQAGYTGFLAFCSATDNPLFIAGQCPSSAIFWALGPQNSDPIYSPGGDWSWFRIRQFYFDALTSIPEDDRESNLAHTFRGLGQVLHLIEDMSVPEHTRNAYHAFGGYEGW